MLLASVTDITDIDNRKLTLLTLDQSQTDITDIDNRKLT